MQGLFDFIAGLGDILWSLINFVISTVLDLLYVLGLMGSLIVKIPDMIGWLPSTCITLTVTAFSIVIIYKILGREG